MTQRALLIGINYIGTSNALHGCINDSYHIGDILRTVYKFPSSNITFMTDDQSSNSPTYPSKTNIIQNLTKMIQQTQPGDVSVFCYSGHGMLLRSTHSTSINFANEDDALIPVDVISKGYYDPANEILDDELWGIVSQVPKDAFLFSVLDCCHSGSAFDLPYNLSVDSSNPSKYSLVRVERRPETTGSIVMLSGCRDDQTSLDAVDGSGKPAGALTYAFCDYIIHHPNDSIHFVDFLTSIRQQIINNNPGVPNLQQPQLDFGRVSDASLTFTLLPNGIAAQLSDTEKKDLKMILKKVYEVDLRHNGLSVNKTVQTKRKSVAMIPAHIRLQRYIQNHVNKK